MQDAHRFQPFQLDFSLMKKINIEITWRCFNCCKHCKSHAWFAACVLFSLENVLTISSFRYQMKEKEKKKTRKYDDEIKPKYFLDAQSYWMPFFVFISPSLDWEFLWHFHVLSARIFVCFLCGIGMWMIRPARKMCQETRVMIMNRTNQRNFSYGI